MTRCAPRRLATLVRADIPDVRLLLAKWNRLVALRLHEELRHAFPGLRMDVCHDASDTLVHLRRARYDLVLLGLTFDDLDGLDLIDLIQHEGLSRRIVVISGRRDERAHDFVRAAAVDAFIDTQVARPDAVTHAVRRLLTGRAETRTWLAPDRVTGQIPLARLLTPAELHVFVVVGGGSDDSAAAERLGLSAHTVHTHRQHIMQKLGVSSHAQLMHEALRRGFVRLAPQRVLYPGSERLLAERAAQSRARRTAELVH